MSARRQTDRRNPISLLCDTEVVTRDGEKQEDGEVFRAVETPTNVDRVESVIISFDVHYVLLILPQRAIDVLFSFYLMNFAVIYRVSQNSLFQVPEDGRLKLSVQNIYRAWFEGWKKLFDSLCIVD